MPTWPVVFASGDPVLVGPDGATSAIRILPDVVFGITLELLDPNGDWANPANAGGTFTYGIESSADGGATWTLLLGNAAGQAVGTRGRDGSLPRLSITGESSLSHASGALCRASARCAPQTIALSLSLTVIP